METKWARKGTSYPGWFIDRLVDEQDKKLAENNRLSSKHKVKIRCQHCDNVLERNVYNVVSKKTGEPVRPCMCKECYAKWETEHLKVMHKNVGNTYRERRTTNIPQEVLESLTEDSREDLLAGNLMRRDEAVFVCRSCRKHYRARFCSRWNSDFTESFVNLCPECSSEHSSEKRVQSFKRRRSEFSKEFVECLFDEPTKSRALERSLSTNEKALFMCCVCGSSVEKRINMVYKAETGQMRCKIYCKDCIPVMPSSFEDEVVGYLSTMDSVTYKRNVRGLLPKPERTSHLLELDIYCPEKKTAVEVNGTYWHASEGNLRSPVSDTHHYKKFSLCAEQSIRLISLYDVDWWFNEERTKNMLMDVFSGSLYRFDVSELILEKLSKDEGHTFVENNYMTGDLQKDGQVSVYYGLRQRGGVLLSVMSFIPDKDTEHWILSRFSTLPRHRIDGGASALFSAFCSEYSPKHVISYTDNDFESDECLKELGFIRDGETINNYYWYKPTVRRYFRMGHVPMDELLKDNIEIVEGYDPSNGQSLESFLLSSLGYYRVFRCGLTRWFKSL